MEVSFMRVFPLCRRTACGIALYPSIRLRFTPARFPSLSLFSPVIASMHIIVDRENANRENAEYAVWQ